jgi:hypothetical protein
MYTKQNPIPQILLILNLILALQELSNDKWMTYLFGTINSEIDVFQHQVKATSVSGRVILELHLTFWGPVHWRTMVFINQVRLCKYVQS